MRDNIPQGFFRLTPRRLRRLQQTQSCSDRPTDCLLEPLARALADRCEPKVRIAIQLHAGCCEDAVDLDRERRRATWQPQLLSAPARKRTDSGTLTLVAASARVVDRRRKLVSTALAFAWG